MLPATPGAEIVTAVTDLTAPLRLGCGEDVAAIVPYLLGFHPRDCVVALICTGNQLMMTARMPLDLLEHPAQLDDQMQRLLLRAPYARWILAGYGTDRERVSQAIDALIDHITPEFVVDALYVHEGRFWSLVCIDADCCPPEGRPFDANTSPAAVHAVVAGLQVLSSREELAECTKPPRGWAARAAKTRFDQAYLQLRQAGFTQSCCLFAETLERGLGDAGELGEADLAVLAAGVTFAPLRDIAFRALSRDTASQHVALWGRVVRGTAKDDSAGPLGMLGLAAWVSGDGALQVVCLERGRRVESGHVLFQLLGDINRAAAPPIMWDSLLDDMYGPERDGAGC